MSLRKAFLSGRGLGSRKITLSSSAINPIQKLGLLQREEDKERGKQEEEEEEEEDGGKGDCWSRMLPEILEEIIQRVESSEDRWPVRKNVVACASVCKTWREITREIVKSPQECGKITFPSSLKEPGPRDLPIQCIIKRNRKNSTFYLYLGVNELSVDEGKFLLAARRFRHGSNTEYIISLDADDFSQGSNAYVGKLCSNFMGTKFAIYDTQPPFNGAKPSNSGMSHRFGTKKVFPQAAGVFNGAKPSNSRMSCRFGRKKVFPQAAGGGNFEIGKVSYKFNLLKSRGPRRMSCALECTGKRGSIDAVQKSCGAQKHGVPSKCVILRNKAPRWHEHLQCWCLNFHGRVTVASVKNFQLVATVDPSQPDEKGDEEMVLLQFGKVGNDLFSMDYREPLSAFQAFAMCLTCFGTKVACE